MRTQTQRGIALHMRHLALHALAVVEIRVLLEETKENEFERRFHSEEGARRSQEGK